MAEENRIDSVKDEEMEKVSGGSGSYLYHYVVKTWKYCLALMESHQQGKLLDRLFNGDKVISYSYSTNYIEGKDWDGTPIHMIFVGKEGSHTWGWVDVDGLQFEDVTEE